MTMWTEDELRRIGDAGELRVASPRAQLNNPNLQYSMTQS